MKSAVAVLAVFTLSCRSVEAPTQDPERPIHSREQVQPWNELGGAGPYSPCNRFEIENVGGKEIQIPIPCDPHWMDKGDPPDSVRVNPLDEKSQPDLTIQLNLQLPT